MTTHDCSQPTVDDQKKPVTPVLDKFPALDEKLQRSEHQRALALLNQLNHWYWRTA